MRSRTLLLIGVCLAIGAAGGFFAGRQRYAAWLQSPSRFQTMLEQTLWSLYGRGVSQIPADSVLLIGDSHLHGLPGAALGEKVTNLSIGGSSAARWAATLEQGWLADVTRVHTVIVVLGHNDLREGHAPEAIAQSIVQLLGRLPPHRQLVLGELIPSADAQRTEHIDAINARLTQLCAQRPDCRLARTAALADSSRRLAAEFKASDNIHLSPIGYARWVEQLNAAMQR